MTKKTYRDLALLTGITLALFSPLFYTHYFYTDEIVQLWRYRKGADFHMFISQGRYLTDRLLSLLFSAIDTIGQISRLHIFSLLGWIACLPVWYHILDKVCRKEQLDPLIPFFTVLYLVVCPPFTIYVSWASTMELFIANSSALIAGYILYSGIRYEGPRIRFSAGTIGMTLLFSIICLFTYQSGIGCFLLPFLLQLISKKKITRTVVAGLIIYLFAFLVYFILYKWQMKVLQLNSDRTMVATNPLNKALWFIGRPLAGAFRFTWIVNERSIGAKIIAAIVLGIYIVLNIMPRGVSASWLSRGRYLLSAFGLLALTYLPSLIARENYASNRTLLALDMGAFLLMFTTLLQWVQKEDRRRLMARCLGTLLVINAWYNFHYQFLGPVKEEYDRVRNYLDTQYHPGITTISFIRPQEDLFQHKYGINTSWDEFGVPSTFFNWVPEHIVKQVVFEKTGDRPAADRLVILNWPDRNAWLRSAPKPSDTTLVVDVENILR